MLFQLQAQNGEITSSSGIVGYIVVGVILVVFCLVLVFLLWRSARKRSGGRAPEVQSRLQDFVGDDVSVQRVNQPSLSPIEEKLRRLEEEEATNPLQQSQEVPPVEEPTFLVEPEPIQSPPAGFAELPADLLEPEFDENLSFLFDDEPEPPPPPDVLEEIEARKLLDQVNKYRLHNQGHIAAAPGELRLLWQDGGQNRQIRVTVLDADTLEVNGKKVPATAEGVKKGIVTTLTKQTF
jgi:hypothetical protein